MAEAALPPSSAGAHPATGRTKFIVGGALILAAMVYLIVAGTFKNAQYFVTVDELLGRTSACRAWCWAIPSTTIPTR
jgi:hypothetical protein